MCRKQQNYSKDQEVLSRKPMEIKFRYDHTVTKMENHLGLSWEDFLDFCIFIQISHFQPDNVKTDHNFKTL